MEYEQSRIISVSPRIDRIKKREYMIYGHQKARLVLWKIFENFSLFLRLFSRSVTLSQSSVSCGIFARMLARVARTSRSTQISKRQMTRRFYSSQAPRVRTKRLPTIIYNAYGVFNPVKRTNLCYV